MQEKMTDLQKLKINLYNMNIKLFFTSLISAALAMPAVGQTVTDRFHFDSSYGEAFSIPNEFSYNGEPCLIMYDGNDNNTVKIYDKNLEVVKKITMRENLPFNYQLTYQNEAREVIAVNEVQKSEIQRYDSYDAFIKVLKMESPSFNESGLIIENMGDGTNRIKVDYSKSSYTSNEQMYFAYSYFGMKYPKVYFIDTGKGVIAYSVNYNVQYTDWKNTGTSVVDCSVKQERIALYNVNLNKGDVKARSYFELSQTLFNDDDSYEYIMPKYKLSTNGNIGTVTNGIENNEEILTKRSVVVSEEKEIALAGFQILSENGNVISDITFDSGFEGSISVNAAFVLTIGDNTFLAFDGECNGTNSTIFYKINKKNTNAIQKVKIAPSSMRISPTVAKSGSTINVTFNDANEKGSDIVVVSASGAAMGSFHVPAGQTSAQIKTNSSAGMYCVSRLQKNKVTETRKILVK